MAVQQAPVVSGDDREASGELILGSWLERVTPTNPPFPSFHVLLTFTPGGGVVGTATIDFAPATRSSPGYGVWVRSGPRMYDAHLLAFSLDAEGRSNGIVHVRERLSINAAGAAYSGSGSFQVIAANGQVVFSGTFSLTASRIRA